MEDERRRQQASPEVQARIRASFERQGLMRHLGARIAHIAPGRVHVVLPSRPEVTQQDGYFHAGATSAIADSAGGYAAFTLFPENTSVLTVEYKINLLAPAVGDHIEALGNGPEIWTNADRVPTGSVRRPGQAEVARCDRPADAHLREWKIQTVTSPSRRHAGLAMVWGDQGP
jgi:uncharacterized protein (TIGR00369 family)